MASLLLPPEARLKLRRMLRTEWFHSVYYRTLYEEGCQPGATPTSAYDACWTRLGDTFKNKVPMEAFGTWLEVGPGALSGYDPASEALRLRALYLRRQAIEVGARMVDAGKVGDVDLGAFAKEVLGISSRVSGNEMSLGVGDVAEEILASATQGQGDEASYGFGFPSLDRGLRGIKRHDFIVLGGTPNAGKSPLALNFLRQRSERNGGHQLVLSLEMLKRDVVTSLVSQYTTIPVDLLNMGTRRENHEAVKGAILGAMSWVEEHFSIADLSSVGKIDQHQFEALAQSVKLSKPLDCILVDYLQCLAREHDKLSEWTAFFKAFALRERVPVIAISSLNREWEKRSQERDFTMPMLSDLRGCGDIEFDASRVLVLQKKRKAGIDQERERLLCVVKNKFGPSGGVYEIDFNPKTLKFKEVPSEGRQAGVHDGGAGEGGDA